MRLVILYASGLTQTVTESPWTQEELVSYAQHAGGASWTLFSADGAILASS